MIDSNVKVGQLRRWDGSERTFVILKKFTSHEHRFPSEIELWKVLDDGTARWEKEDAILKCSVALDG